MPDIRARSTPDRPVMVIWRLAASVVIGAAASVLTIAFGDWRYAPSVGWDATALVFCASEWQAIWPMSPGQTAARATREDPSRATRDLVVLTSCLASLVALGMVLVYAHQVSGAAQVALALLSVVSVALSWFSVHTIFTLRYALLYYTPPEGGIDFSPSSDPDYRDFAYLALTIGMTYQVSDTALQTSDMRATALRHALLSYLFGAVIVAAAVNLVVSMSAGR